MLVKTFQAPTMAEALRLVKAELGPDAMILSTKKEKQGGILGFFSKQVVKVTAAIDPHRPAPPPPPPVRERPERERTTKEEFENSMLAPLARELRDLREKVEVMTKRDEELRQRQSEQASLPADQQSKTGDGGINLNNIPRQDLEEIKKLLLNTLVRSQEGGVKSVQWPDAAIQTSAGIGVPSEKPPLVRELERQGIEPDLQGKIIETVNTLPMGQGEETLKGRLGEAFGRLIRFAGNLRMKKNAPRIIALVGPTGVGKTTTTAKLAAMYALNRGNKVALITMDIFRVGAVEQLKTYTKIMGIPLEVASTPKELERAVERHSDCDLILIDTAGRSHKDSDKLEEMKGFLETTIQSDIYLCLSATTKDRELEVILNRFSIFPISKVVFTKLDECESVGCIVNLLLKANLQIAYFTTGQRVPEDIEVATSEKLAELILKEGAQ
ncbi:flagellar biosynthesis protein FlhF [Trichlorobacter thiogenes]|uniref:Flagellar biosynthesis protein FlhF n=1 Tax=Trichlorobacter thiogenes TaxID=115783 RepID=A0A1T4JT53_9BACT|nr:flagellar biosynthesis protein FlhF [Trichlorobacter thiogenes]SJZ33321.1 flagellar biosynthesis protein FlhF [Trichlorobacter thiogenes]